MPEAEADWRRNNIGHLLFAASDRFLREKLASVHAAGFAIGETQVTLLLNLDPGGTRPGELAARMNLTRPSVSEVIARTEYSGLAARSPDPADSRARLITLTPPGDKVLAAIHRAIAAAEARFVDEAGCDLAHRFRHEFGAYAAGLDDAGRSSGWHSGNAGRVLALAARRFVREVLSIVHASGHVGIGEAMLSLVRNLDLAGSRLTDLGARAHITKQSMRELVNRGEALGIVERVPDDDDKRAKLIRFTPSGVAMLEDMRCAVVAAEGRLAERVSTGLLAEVRAALRAYAGFSA